jgi:hypothetical protein
VQLRVRGELEQASATVWFGEPGQDGYMQQAAECRAAAMQNVRGGNIAIVKMQSTSNGLAVSGVCICSMFSDAISSLSFSWRDKAQATLLLSCSLDAALTAGRSTRHYTCHTDHRVLHGSTLL